MASAGYFPAEIAPKPEFLEPLGRGRALDRRRGPRDHLGAWHWREDVERGRLRTSFRQAAEPLDVIRICSSSLRNRSKSLYAQI